MAISLEETIKDCEEKSHQFNPIAAKQQFQIKLYEFSKKILEHIIIYYKNKFFRD